TSGGRLVTSALLLALLSRRNPALLVRSQESLAIEVNEMGWRFSNPDLGLPRDVVDESRQRLPIQKRRHEHETDSRVGEERAQFLVTLRANGAMTRYSLDEH